MKKEPDPEETDERPHRRQQGILERLAIPVKFETIPFQHTGHSQIHEHQCEKMPANSENRADDARVSGIIGLNGR